MPGTRLLARINRGSASVLKRLLAVLALSFVLPAWADQAQDVDNVRQLFAKIIPGEQPESIRPAAVPGMYEVVFGAQVMYVSGDGRYIFQGDLIDLKARENLTETARAKQRAKLLKVVNEDDMIIFTPKNGEVKYRVNVFTDIDCGYCRKLHRQIDEYLAEGIEIRYLAFPRSGVNTKSYYKAVTVWCSEDRLQAMTEAKAGKKQPRIDCDNPVRAQLELGDRFGVTGTPTLVLENGDVIPGYVPPKRLLGILRSSQQARL